MIRVATYNVENLFRRAEALYQDTWQESEPILNDWNKMNRTLAKAVYSDADKEFIAEFLVKYKLHLRDSRKEKFFSLREIRGKLFKIPRGSNTPEIIASGRDDWDGFIEMKRTEVKSAAVRNTGLVLQALNADVVALMEVEDRTALKRFSEDILGPLDGQVAYDRYMLIDGNDERGIDVGLFSRFPIVNICSHVDAGLPASRIFSRDCAEYEVALDNGDRLWIMVNHFKSKGFGNAAANNARRLAQAEEVARLYTKRLETHDLVIVAGDLNDTPTSAPLAPLVQNTDLRDAMSHPTYTSKPGVRPGTFGTGTARNKIDYLLLSPKLWDKVHDVDVERRGVWAPNTFPHFDEVDGPLTAASDHAAVWADLDIN